MPLAFAGLSLTCCFPSAAADEETTEWSEVLPLASQSLLLDVARAGGQFVAVGERGQVLLRPNGPHEVWTQVRVPTRNLLTAVTSVGEGRLWAVGHDAVILHSADGGRLWTRQFSAPDDEAPLLDVWFEDERHGLAVGAYGLALETDDGGSSWRRRTISDEEPHFNAIAEGADGALFIAAEFGLTFRSRDRGETWETHATSYGGSLFDVLPLSDGAVLFYGLRGTLFRSPDGGPTLERINTGTTASLLCGTELAGGPVVIAGLSGTILVSDDGGRSFVAANRSDRRGIAAVLEVADGGGFLLGEGGVEEVETLRSGPRAGPGER